MCVWETGEKLEADLQQAAAKSRQSFYACLRSLSVDFYLIHLYHKRFLWWGGQGMLGVMSRFWLYLSAQVDNLAKSRKITLLIT